METSPPPWELSPKVFDQQSDERMASKSNEHGLRIPNPFWSPENVWFKPG